MSIEAALEYMQTAWQGSKLGLERTVRLLDALGNPQDKLKFVHVTGTNGKGSISAMIESVLRKSGYKTGLFTSPAITRFNERIRINGEDIPDGDVEYLVDKMKPIADAMNDDTPTEFEVVTAMAMQYFYEQKVDIAILEVGMGGRGDSTNVIRTPEAAVFAAVGLDHTEFLGDTIQDIAREKSGIIKESTSVVSYPQKEEVTEVLLEACAKTYSILYEVKEEDVVVKHCDLTGCTFDFKEMKDMFVPLCGTYQPYNAAVAITAAKALAAKGWKITEESIREGIANVRWLGRFEVMRREPPVILDGSHNPHGISATVKTLKEQFGDRKVIFVTGVMADKDVHGIYESLVPLAKEFHAVTPHNVRSMAAKDLAALLTGLGSTAYSHDSIEDGIRQALENAGDSFPVVAIGSLYFSNDIRTALKKYL
ncbi:MAG: bifunctional folylpolyglutamate synthase/dihydrofolate synthase [Eubacterium sp.]|nr:bifunctional folylpolyglutamate synthase/dihydrofolate synthase [Eubacterium sp.]